MKAVYVAFILTAARPAGPDMPFLLLIQPLSGFVHETLGLMCLFVCLCPTFVNSYKIVYTIKLFLTNQYLSSCNNKQQLLHRVISILTLKNSYRMFYDSKVYLTNGYLSNCSYRKKTEISSSYKTMLLHNFTKKTILTIITVNTGY